MSEWAGAPATGLPLVFSPLSSFTCKRRVAGASPSSPQEQETGVPSSSVGGAPPTSRWVTSMHKYVPSLQGTHAKHPSLLPHGGWRCRWKRKANPTPSLLERPPMNACAGPCLSGRNSAGPWALQLSTRPAREELPSYILEAPTLLGVSLLELPFTRH